MERGRAWRLAGALCGLVVALDQGVKAVVESNLFPGEHVDVLGPIGLTLAHNTRVAFGLAGDGGGLLVAFALGSLLFIGWLFSRDPTRPWMWVAVGLLAGGALGNLADRIRAEAVTDYVDIFSWPPFNLADVSITLGVVLLALSLTAERMSELRIVHIDDSLAVVDKPAGLVVHPAPSHQGPTLVDELGEILGGGEPERPGIVHRLDKGTSGLMVVARDEDSLRALQAQVRRRDVERVYLALAGGRLPSRSGTIDAPIGRAARQRHRMAVAGAAPRQARTHFEVVELLSRETLLEARLETGRTHQIRAHFAAIDHPLLGDPTYGGELRYGLERPFLHAHRLGFSHPSTEKRLTFTSELPEDL